MVETFFGHGASFFPARGAGNIRLNFGAFVIEVDFLDTAYAIPRDNGLDPSKAKITTPLNADKT